MRPALLGLLCRLFPTWYTAWNLHASVPSLLVLTVEVSGTRYIGMPTAQSSILLVNSIPGTAIVVLLTLLLISILIVGLQ